MTPQEDTAQFQPPDEPLSEDRLRKLIEHGERLRANQRYADDEEAWDEGGPSGLMTFTAGNIAIERADLARRLLSLHELLRHEELGDRQNSLAAGKLWNAVARIAGYRETRYVNDD